MQFLDGRAQAGRDRQFESLAKEAASAGSRVVECVTIAPDGMSTGQAVSGAVRALFGGRFKVDTISVLWLESHGWRHCYVQPYSGMTPMPGEHFGQLSGNLPAPAILRRGGMFKAWQWESASFPAVSHQLSQ